MWSAKHSFLIILTAVIRGKYQWETLFKRIKPLYWRNIELWCADLMMIWLKWQKKKKSPSCSWVYNYLLKLTYYSFPFLTKIHLLWLFKPHLHPLSMCNTPSLKALYCFVYLCLSSSTCIHASFTLFKWLFKGHVFRDTSLSMQHEMVLQSIFISSLAFSLFPPPLLYPFLSPSFFLVPFLLFCLNTTVNVIRLLWTKISA